MRRFGTQRCPNSDCDRLKIIAASLALPVLSPVFFVFGLARVVEIPRLHREHDRGRGSRKQAARRDARRPRQDATPK